jgi:hypothetical protein
LPVCVVGHHRPDPDEHADFGGTTECPRDDIVSRAAGPYYERMSRRLATRGR